MKFKFCFVRYIVLFIYISLEERDKITCLLYILLEVDYLCSLITNATGYFK